MLSEEIICKLGARITDVEIHKFPARDGVGVRKHGEVEVAVRMLDVEVGVR